MVVASNGSGHLRLGAGGSEKVRITSAGNVGIGSTIPVARLDAYKNFSGVGVGNYAGRVYGTDSGVSETGVRFVTKGTGDLHNASDAYLMHGISNGTTRFVFGANGNIGIGLTNPDKTLVVKGADSEVAIDDTNGTPLLRFRNNGSTGSEIGLTSSNDLTFTSGGNTERFRVDSNGLIGIGTDNPSAKLNIAGSDTQLLNLMQDSGDLAIRLNDRGTGSAYIKVRDNTLGSLSFDTGGSERLRITSTGLVGIGTDNPASPLHIGQSTDNSVTGITLKNNPSIGAQRFTLYNEEDVGTHYNSNDGGTGRAHIFESGGTERLRITSDGELELRKNQDGVTGRPDNRIIFKDTDTSVAANQPIGEISWYSTDAGMVNVNSYIRGINEATNGSGALTLV